MIHAHDWQAGLVAGLPEDAPVAPIRSSAACRRSSRSTTWRSRECFRPATLAEIGLGWDVFNLQALEYWGQISYLKAGINFSEQDHDRQPDLRAGDRDAGDGLRASTASCSRRAADLVGILNGIDTERWNPAADQYVAARFSADDLHGKARARSELLLEAAGLPRDEAAMARPVIGMVTRLTDQKGCDLVAAAADELMALDATWVMLGSGEPRYEELWRWLAARYPDRVAARIGFDERLAHLIEAGADMFLMPSRFEPCGLNQMYSLRYGTVPIVRATGRARGHRRGLRRGDRTGHRLQVPRLHAGGAGRRRRAGRRRCTATANAGGESSRTGMRQDLLLGRFGPGVCQSV